MNKISFLLIIMCFTTTLMGQIAENVSLKWGETFKRPSWSFINKVAATDASGFYVWRKKLNDDVLEHFDHQMNLTKGATIDLSYENGNREKKLEDFIHFNNTLFMLSSYYDKGLDKNMLFAQRIDKASLTPDRAAPLIATIAAEKSYNRGFFDYKMSRDSSKLLIYNKMPYNRRGQEEFAFRVFDDNFQLLWEKEVALPYEDKLFEVVSYEVSRSGDVFVLGKLYFERVRERRRGQPNYQYVILAYRNNGEQTKEYPVSLGEDFVSELTFRVANNGDLICAGFYSERSSTNLKGSFFLRIEADSQKAYDIGKQPFSKAFLEKFMSERRAKKGRELFSYSLDHLILRSDGGALLIAEQFYVRVTTFRDNLGNWNETRTYYYNDIIAVNINPNGSIAWSTKIPKRQVDGTGYVSSYTLAVVKGKIHFIFNDHPQNLREKDPDRLKNFRGKRSVVTLVSLKPDGDYDKFPLFDNRDIKVATRPKIGRQISKNEVLIFGEYRKKYKFGKAVFK